ncbi:MAG: hypothetical protein PHO26_06600 [Dehalococcoidia bacterium]|nr:hypothetical protein [Dehalococcoidia bacterium]MDD5494701.1 hypothetical protein [Dehalococcoidia bacterium]
MTKPTNDIARATWQVTATTIHCEIINDYVTIMVYNDWHSKCTWCEKNKQSTGGLINKLSGNMRVLVNKCHGPECEHISSYRDKLIMEETGKAV